MDKLNSIYAGMSEEDKEKFRKAMDTVDKKEAERRRKEARFRGSLGISFKSKGSSPKDDGKHMLN